MPLFRKKPITVYAEQFYPGNDWEDLPQGVRREYQPWPKGTDETTRRFGRQECRFFIDTLEGAMEVKSGDWVITGVKGERYPCKPDIFELTYEPA